MKENRLQKRVSQNRYYFVRLLQYYRSCFAIETNKNNIMKTIKKIMLGLLAAPALLLVGCSSDDDATPQNGNLTLAITNLEDLGTNARYEGWLLVDGTPISTGTFSVDASGVLSETSFSVATETLNDATKFILTVEPNPDSDPAPSAQKLIAGDFNGTTAAVSTSVAPAIGDFSSVAGSFFLRSPTDEPVGSVNNGNDESGVWFGLPGAPPTPDFTLPTLPEGWVYEGWVVGETGPLSTGQFTAFDTVDLNAGASSSFSGTEQVGPPIPGEDFFNNAPTGETFPLDIRGRTVVISIEPSPDNSPAPFLLKPLAAVAGNDTAPATYSFNQNLGSFPTGTVTR